MKRTLKIFLIALILLIIIGLFSWYFLLRNPNVPAGEAFRDILPFGSGEGTNLPLNNTPSLVEGEEFGVVDGRPIASLFRITDSPVAGFIILSPSTISGQASTTTTVRYTDRATGHIYDTELATLVKTKITNTTLTKIYEAHFNSSGTKVLYRSLRDDDTVENTSLTLVPPRASDTSGLYTLSTTLLRGDVREVEVGAGDTLYYVLRDTQAIATSNFEGSSSRNILVTPFTNWRLDVYGSALLAWTKASASAEGYAYSLNTTNGSLTKILGPLLGLTVTPHPTGERVAYSHIEDGVQKLFAREAGSAGRFEIRPATLAEKCVWGTERTWMLYCGVPIIGVSGDEPDNWYKGITHFSDRIWSFDTRVDISEIVAEPKLQYEVDMDVYEPQVSPTEDYMVFINKNDLSLWALRLE